jgi:hypothetical protein
MRWRTALAEAAGLPSLFRFESYGGTLPWTGYENDPLVILLNHSDCDGEIACEDCIPLADRLSELLPEFSGKDLGGHVGDCEAKTQRFIDGLRRAAEAKETVEFF